MSKYEKINLTLCKLKEKLGIKENVKVRLKPFKRKIASVSLRKNTIYLNSEVIQRLTDKELEYIIAHELLHLKYGVFHTKEFENELKKLFDKNLELRILKRILKKK
ncbi:M56 family metallopeptidase [Aquifex pyrophilus]